mgnify:FL=1
MKNRPLITEQKTVKKEDRPLRNIYSIEALRKKIGCASYDDLKPLGYDVDGYFSRKEEDPYVPTDYDSNGCYWGT